MSQASDEKLTANIPIKINEPTSRGRRCNKDIRFRMLRHFSGLKGVRQSIK